MSEKVFCVSHNISFYNQLIDSPQTIPACLVDEQGISIVPVFSTGDMGDRGLFYKISIAPEGIISMTTNADITSVLYKSSPGTGTTTASDLSSSALHNHIMSDFLANTTNLIRQAVRDKETSFKSLGVTSEFKISILDDPNFLIKLRYSSYTADTVKLSYLLELFKQTAKLDSSTSLSPGIISPQLINDILITSIVSAAQVPVFDSKYVEVLWENKFLNKDIDTLAKLLKKYKPDLRQSEMDIKLFLSNFQSEKIIESSEEKRKQIGENALASWLGIPNDPFISWIQTEATSMKSKMVKKL